MNECEVELHSIIFVNFTKKSNNNNKKKKKNRWGYMRYDDTYVVVRGKAKYK